MSVSIAERIENTIANSSIRVLVIGGGIAGATFAGLMRRQGNPVAVIEAAAESADAGYMLGLLPLGGRVLNALHLNDAYLRNSSPVGHYEMFGRNGQLLQQASLMKLVGYFGSWQGIERSQLLTLLRRSAEKIEYDTTIINLCESSGGVTVTFRDRSQAIFDLIVAADGIHSCTREMVSPPLPATEFNTGWGGFVVWSSLESQSPNTYRELWADGWGVGIYPVPGRVGVFLAGTHAAMKDRSVDDYADDLVDRVPDGPFANALKKRDKSASSFYWKMHDYRAKDWIRGRTILLGDSAAAFLPTAGVGASAAMDSAAALADEFSRADREHVEFALRLYEKRQRRRIERLQSNSRKLAKYMFVTGRAKSWFRDQLMKFYTTEMLVREISQVIEGA